MHEQHNGGAMMKLPRYFALPKLTIKGGGYSDSTSLIIPMIRLHNGPAYKGVWGERVKTKGDFSKDLRIYGLFYVIFMSWLECVDTEWFRSFLHGQ